MGNRLDGFDIDLEFDHDGQVKTIRYTDQEGCGASRILVEDLTIGEVIRHHLAHYKSSHRMEPLKMCPAEGNFMDEPYYCTLTRHGNTVGHNFVKKGRS